MIFQNFRINDRHKQVETNNADKKHKILKYGSLAKQSKVCFILL